MKATDEASSAQVLRDAKLTRMLAAFEADLPGHDLGRWLVTATSNDTVVLENDGHAGRHYCVYDDGYVRIAGFAECLRCNRRFDIPQTGNFITPHARIGTTVARAKQWVAAIARRDGPCWGDVPESGEQRTVYAVVPANC